MTKADWGSDGQDTDHPNVARMYDYYLGGTHNFPVDRELAQRVIGTYPQLPAVLRHGRLFLSRVVRHLCDQGIAQFIDLGSGLPTAGNVHEIAQAVNPQARVVYVDIDQTAVTHSRVMLLGNPLATVVQGDIRQIDTILRHRDLRHVIDLDRPVAVLMFALLQFIRDEEKPEAITAAIFEAVAPGSYMSISHGGKDIVPAEAEKVAVMYARSGNPLIFRTHAEVVGLFDRFEVLPPGVVPVDEWYPDEQSLREVAVPMSGYGGLAVKR